MTLHSEVKSQTVQPEPDQYPETHQLKYFYTELRDFPLKNLKLLSE